MEMIWENKKTWQQEKLEDVKTPQDSQREEHLLPLSLSLYLCATIKARDIVIPPLLHNLKYVPTDNSSKWIFDKTLSTTSWQVGYFFNIIKNVQ